jgi:hypothetical protein
MAYFPFSGWKGSFFGDFGGGSMTFDGLLSARIVLTIITAGYSVVPVLADLNNTHATNPLWTPHARFHVVWQASSYVALALLGLGLIWVPGPSYIARLYLASAFGAAVYGGFFMALCTMAIYRGKTYDENGHLPLPVRILGRDHLWDLNITVFSGAVVLLIMAVALVLRAGG